MTKPEAEAIGWSFLRSRRWFGYYALIAVFSIVCVLLGNWQFDRRAQAQAEIARIDKNYDAAPIPVEAALHSHESFDIDANKWQPVVLTGTYLGEPFLARNRPGEQGVGSILIHPLRLADGTLFFVDRGWIPVSAAEGLPDDLPMPSGGDVEVVVRLRASEAPVQGRESTGQTLASINASELSETLQQPAYTGAYGQLISETPAGEHGTLPPKPERDEGPHLSYALQWYVFILIALGGAWYAATLEYRSLNAGSKELEAALARARERKRKRGLTDAEEEDAYLDA